MSTTRGQGPFYLGIDLGGTNVKAGVVDDQGVSLSRCSLPTEAEQGPDHGIAQIHKAGRMAIDESPVSAKEILAVGLATPGTMDIPAGMLLNPPNLPGWEHVPIRLRVEKLFNIPTILQNDANAAAYGEWWVGAGRNSHSLVLWTLGTGIGCGIIVGETIISGEHSHGSECGHLIIEMDNGRLCNSGQRGTLEAYAGAKAVVLRCREALETGRDSVLQQWCNEGQELTPLLIAQAAEAGDELAEEIIMDTAKYLGVGITTVMHTINPALFLIGGAMTFGRNETALGRRFLERIKEEVRHRAFPTPAEKTLIDYATLGGDAGYIGAAGCARRKV